MSRFGLAISCFFGVLFRGKLPAEAAPLLPEELVPVPPALPPTLPEVPAVSPARTTNGALASSPAIPRPSAAPARGPEASDLRSEGALAVLGLLQREGRLVDFLRESLDQHPDDQIGAAVRDIHRGCKKVLDEHLRLEPVMPGREDGPVVVPRGFDPAEVRLIGKTAGDPPFRGILVHHGWRAVDVKLPTLSEGVDRRVLAPAEVRLG
jgi:Domain of unknown function (DUF2760)